MKSITERGLDSPWLTDDEEVAQYYAEVAVDEHGGEPVVIEVDADESRLRASTREYEEPLTFFRAGLSESDWHDGVEDGTIAYPKNDGDWKTSLRVVRSARFDGVLPVPRPGKRSRSNPPVDFAAVNPQERYREFNRKYFGGQLPNDMPITLKPMKRASGETSIRVIVLPPHTISDVKRHARFSPVPSSMARILVPEIKISNLIRFDESVFDMVLLHEMCHVAVAQAGWPFEHHGRNFVAEAHRVGKLAGIHIPLTHAAVGEVNAAEREVGILLVTNKAGDKAYCLFSPKALHDFIERAKVMNEDVKVFVTRSKLWAHVPVKRLPEKYGFRLWKWKPEYDADLASGRLEFEMSFDDEAMAKRRRERDERLARRSLESRGLRPASNPRSALLEKLRPLRAEIARRAQAIYDAWEQDEDGNSEDFGGGGICDAVAEEVGAVLSGAGIDSLDGGHDGDDHAFLVAFDARHAYAVDIPPGVYERGSGYSWKKLPGVTITEDDVAVDPVDRKIIEEEVDRRAEYGEGLVGENPPLCRVSTGKFMQSCGARATKRVLDEQGRPYKLVCGHCAKRFERVEDMDPRRPA